VLTPTARLVHEQVARLRAHPPEAEELARAATNLIRAEAFYFDTARKFMDHVAHPAAQAAAG
jgi:hypothetical protein